MTGLGRIDSHSLGADPAGLDQEEQRTSWSNTGDIFAYSGDASPDGFHERDQIIPSLIRVLQHAGGSNVEALTEPWSPSEGEQPRDAEVPTVELSEEEQLPQQDLEDEVPAYEPEPVDNDVNMDDQPGPVDDQLEALKTRITDYFEEATGPSGPPAKRFRLKKKVVEVPLPPSQTLANHAEARGLLPTP